MFRSETARRAAGATAAMGLALAVCACGGTSAAGTRSTAAASAAASSMAPAPATASAAATTSSAESASAPHGTLKGPVLAQPQPAPRVVLRNYLGQRVDLAAYHGRAILLTFIYTHCPDVCPLIVSSLHNALAGLGPAANRVQVVAISTDPRGDTPAAIRSFLAHRDMLGRMQYLVGSRRQLVPVWRGYGVSVSDPTSQDEVAHTAVVFGITGSGKVTTAYPSNFTPAEIDHDVPLLAAS